MVVAEPADPETVAPVGVAFGNTMALREAAASGEPWSFRPNVPTTAVPAAILGGLDSTKGALFGGIIVGVAQQLMFGYQSRFNEWLHKTIDITIGSFHYQAGLGPNFHLVFPYLIMIVILLVRPYGLFGSREVRRV